MIDGELSGLLSGAVAGQRFRVVLTLRVESIDRPLPDRNRPDDVGTFARRERDALDAYAGSKRLVLSGLGIPRARILSDRPGSPFAVASLTADEIRDLARQPEVLSIRADDVVRSRLRVPGGHPLIAPALVRTRMGEVQSVQARHGAQTAKIAVAKPKMAAKQAPKATKRKTPAPATQERSQTTARHPARGGRSPEPELSDPRLPLVLPLDHVVDAEGLLQRRVARGVVADVPGERGVEVDELAVLLQPVAQN